MDEYIKRDAALLAISYYPIENPEPGDIIPAVLETARKAIAKINAADVAPVRNGRWDSSWKYRFQKDNSVAVRCTECGCTLTEPEYRSHVWNYCPVCGAKMDGGMT